MSVEDIQKGKQQLTVLCRALGCSGLSKACPGDPSCSILRNIGHSKWAADTIHEADKHNAESTTNYSPE